MRSFKIINTLIGLLLLGAQSVVNAATIGVCTFAGGCGPDFNIVSVSVDYAYNAGIDEGVLTITGVGGNVSFLEGQLDATWSATYEALDPSKLGRISIPVTSIPGGPYQTVATNKDFSLTVTVDGNGSVVAGGASNVTMNGAAWVNPSVGTAISANGTALDGTLITGGSVNQIGSGGTGIDFVGNIDNSSLLTTAGFGTGFGGVLGLGSITTTSGVVEWNKSWESLSGNTLDVVVPVPAAAWLFLSGLTALVTVSRKK